MPYMPPKPPIKKAAGAKAPVKKTVQSMRQASTLPKASAYPPKSAKGSGTGTPTRATATTAPRRPRDVGTPYVAERKSPRGSADTTRYGRAVGTEYVKKRLPKTK